MIKLQRRRLPCWVNVEPFDYKDYSGAGPELLSFETLEECLAYIKRALKFTDEAVYIKKDTSAVMWSGSVLGWIRED